MIIKIINALNINQFLRYSLFWLLLLLISVSSHAAPLDLGSWTVSDASLTPITSGESTAPVEGSGFVQRQIIDETPTGYTQTIISSPVVSLQSISGKLTDAATGELVAGITIEIYDASGVLQDSVLSNDTGLYHSNPIAVGSYYAKTVATDQYLANIFYRLSNLSCFSSCDVTTGSLIILAERADGLVTVTNTDFRLEQGGRFSGSVTDVDTGEPLADIYLNIFDATGTWFTSATTDVNGTITFPQNTILPSGDYYISTHNRQGYFNERYDDDLCTYCDITAGTPVTVTHGNITTGINLALKKGGRMSGTVTDIDTGDPLSGISLAIYNASANIYTSGWTDENGYYVSDTALPAGSYLVYTINGSGYLDQDYNGSPCGIDCNLQASSPIVVEAGNMTTDIDFALKKGGRISGSIIDDSGSPLPYISLYIYDADGNVWDRAQAGIEGYYVSGKGLLDGQYYIHTRNIYGYVDERYDGESCIAYDCDPTSGTAISVVQGQVTTDIDFSLVLGGRISGSITDASTQQALPYASIYIYNADGDLVDIAFSYSAGQYTTNAGLLPGIYYAHTVNYDGYIDKRFNDIALAGIGAIIDATPIVVSMTETTSGIDFSLEQGSRLSGRITNAETGLAFKYIHLAIDIFDFEGDMVSRLQADINGDYLSRSALPPGKYYVRAYDYDGKLESQLYGAIPFNSDCGEWQRCDVITSTPVTILSNSDAQNIDFSLSVKSNVIDAASSEQIDTATTGTGSMSTSWLLFLMSIGLMIRTVRKQGLAIG